MNTESPLKRHEYGVYLGSVLMTNKKIGLVTGLEAEEFVAENGLAVLDDIQPPISRIIEWDSWVCSVRLLVHPNQADQELTEEPVDIDQAAYVGHHVQNLWSENQGWCLRL